MILLLNTVTLTTSPVIRLILLLYMCVVFFDSCAKFTIFNTAQAERIGANLRYLCHVIKVEIFCIEFIFHIFVNWSDLEGGHVPGSVALIEEYRRLLDLQRLLNLADPGSIKKLVDSLHLILLFRIEASQDAFKHGSRCDDLLANVNFIIWLYHDFMRFIIL